MERARSSHVSLLCALASLAGCGGDQLPATDAGLVDVGSDAPVYAFSIAPTIHDFGDLCLGHEESSFEFILSNEGTAALVGLTVTMQGDVDDYLLDRSACDRVEVGGTCPVSVRPVVRHEGGSAATLQVSLAGLTAEAYLSLQGAFCENGPTVSPTPERFEDTVVGEISAEHTFRVTWKPTWLSGFDVMVSGLDATSFEIRSDHCSGPVDAAASECTFTAVFRPTRPGEARAVVQAMGWGSYASSGYISGAGLARAANVEIAPHTSNLGVVGIGCEGPIETLTLTSTGTIPTGPLRVSLGGDDAGSFAIVNDRCAAGLAVGERCDVDVRFVPLRAGGALATLDVAVTGGTRRAALTGLATTDPCAS
jgi:hypothetical protein